MITVLGDQFGVKLPECEEDLTLFVDIQNQPISLIAYKNPATTYVITSKSLVDSRQYICAGFYNILYNVDPRKLTLGVVHTFLQTKYEDNRIKLVVDNLIPLYTEYGTVIGCINGLLTSIETGDLAKFSQLVKFNLSTMKDSLVQIELMYGLSKAFYDDKENLESMRTATAQLSAKDVEIMQYRNKLEELNTQLTDISISLKDMTAKYRGAQEEIAELATKGTDIEAVTSHPAYIQLNQTLASVQEELTKVSAENASLRATSGISANPEDGLDVKDNIILQLRESLNQAQSMSWADVMLKKLPAVTSSVSLQAKKILYFKEVKPTIYINSLVRWLQAYMNQRVAAYNKTFLIIVFDQLTDQFTCKKYDKRGWALNGPPKANSNVVITNEVSLEFLKGTLNLQYYDYIVAIDRFHLFTDVIDTPVTERFYLINTVADMEDFKLDPDRCIGFFEWPKNSDRPLPCKYTIMPSDPGLATAQTETRGYKILKDRIWGEIVKGVGIDESV